MWAEGLGRMSYWLLVASVELLLSALEACGVYNCRSVWIAGPAELFVLCLQEGGKGRGKERGEVRGGGGAGREGWGGQGGGRGSRALGRVVFCLELWRALLIQMAYSSYREGWSRKAAGSAVFLVPSSNLILGSLEACMENAVVVKRCTVCWG